MKDASGKEIQSGHIVLASQDRCKEDQYFTVLIDGNGDFIFTNDKYAFNQVDLGLLGSLGIKLWIVNLCPGCEKYFPLDDLSTCKYCGGPVCEGCQQPFYGPPNPPVDFSCHKLCYENAQWEKYSDEEPKIQIKFRATTKSTDDRILF